MTRRAYACKLAGLIGPEEKSETAQIWLAAGSVLLDIACRLGGYGVLLVLPPTVPRSVWEVHLRRTSPRFEEVIDALARRGIRESAEAVGAYRAGLNIAARLELPPLAHGVFP